MRNEAGTQLATVLVVDDQPENLRVVTTLLKDEYRVRVATSGQQALELASQVPQPHLILLDVMMPGMDGYDVCSRLRSEAATVNIPIIFLTAVAETSEEERGFAMGAVDYITKPISPPILRARVRTHLALTRARDVLRDENSYLEAEVEKRTRQVELIKDVTIIAMASLAETRSNETGHHLMRTQRYVRALARQLRNRPRFAGFLNDDYIDLIYKSAPLHDIGKVGIPDQILLKPGILTNEEFDVMKTHTRLGLEAIRRAEKCLEGEERFLDVASEIALFHHERWDGSGYPEGLSGDAIPLSARMMAIGDVYDALISERVYKSALNHEEAVAIIENGKGTQFDPDMVAAFLEVAEEFRSITMEFSGSPAT